MTLSEALLLQPTWVTGLLGFVLGAMIGSFLNVVRYRVPRKISLLNPSACPSCKAHIRWYQNVPIFAYVVLRGRCVKCKAQYPAIYVVYEIVFGTVFAFIAVASVIIARQTL